MSRTLLVDLGNTRIKWAWLSPGGRVGRMQAAAHAGWKAKDFFSTLDFLQRGDHVFAVSVAAPAVRRAFADAARARTGRTPKLLRSERASAGVRNGYREAWRLGADRWAALIGAGHLQGDVLIVDIGTAATLDLLDSSGRHHGGAILPGEGLMVSSLLVGTGGIRRRAGAPRSRPRSLFGRSTREAVEAGAHHALLATLEAAVSVATGRLGRRPRVVLTGGGAASLRKTLSMDHEWRPALVLEGLAAFLRHSAVRGERPA